MKLKGGVFKYQTLSDKERKNLMLLDIIMQKGPISRTDISRETELNIVTVSNYINNFIDKGIVVKDIIEGCRMAKKAGLIVHLTMIVGWPLETKQDVLKTFELAKKLMQSGDADLLQATVLIPYPGTALWKEAKENKWFLFNPEQYERYDMRESVLKVKGNAEDVASVCGKIYTIFLTPKYIFARLKSINSWEDFKFNLRGAWAVVGHLRDFVFGIKK